MQAAYAAVTPEQWHAATAKVLKHVMDTGSIRAWSVLRDTLAGKPAQHVKHEEVQTPEDWLNALLDEDTEE